VKARKSFLTAGLVAACATLFGIGETLQYYLRSRLWGYPFTWAGSLSENVLTSFILAALTPIAFFMSRRFRFGRQVMRKRLPLHALAGLVFAIGAVCAIAALAVARKPDLQFESTVWKLGTFYVLFYFAIYWAIVGAIHAAHYYSETQSREERLVRERLEVLRSKLNPHFLFNTLNAISTMALQRDHERVTQSLALLGDMLRATLDDSLPQEIPLSRELDLTDKYLALQRIRFGDRLRVVREIDARTLDALVPSMFLQPLIENAIVHGVGAKPGDGWVKIETRPVDGQLVVAVSDSGNGFAAPSGSGNGIGLANTRERLATLYGGAQRLELQSLPDAGAQVTIEIPLRRGA
jgi:two-component system, LytTR family, sensor kinase